LNATDFTKRPSLGVYRPWPRGLDWAILSR